MKKIGIVKEYNGEFGKILDNKNKEYILLKEDVLLKELKENDLVMFKEDTIKEDDLGDLTFARFVENPKKLIK